MRRYGLVSATATAAAEAAATGVAEQAVHVMNRGKHTTKTDWQLHSQLSVAWWDMLVCCSQLCSAPSTLHLQGRQFRTLLASYVDTLLKLAGLANTDQLAVGLAGTESGMLYTLQCPMLSRCW
jgi:hypothetical protein